MYCLSKFISENCYTPFGMVMPGRTFSATSYRFGFNGKEKDDEVKGTGNSLDFGARIYDSRVGRFYSIDPYQANFPWQSSYLFAGNNPIKFIDKEGKFQLDPSMDKSHPLIYKYLSTQIEKDVMNSTNIKNAYKGLNPKITDDYLRSVFQNNSGPVLYSIQNPGGFSGAVGHLDYEQNDASIIEINTKVFNYVENILENSTNKDDKQAALMLLYGVVLHETGHEVVGYDGTNVEGQHMKVSQSEKASRSFTEDGSYVENEVWRIPMKIEPNDKRPDVINGLSPSNPKLKAGEMQENIKRSKSTEDLPTVP